MAVPEARLEPSDGGLVAASEGWFVVNVRDADWVTNPVLGDACVIEGDPAIKPTDYALSPALTAQEAADILKEVLRRPLLPPTQH